jgi:hypothetical protein
MLTESTPGGVFPRCFPGVFQRKPGALVGGRHFSRSCAPSSRPAGRKRRGCRRFREAPTPEQGLGAAGTRLRSARRARRSALTELPTRWAGWWCLTSGGSDIHSNRDGVTAQGGLSDCVTPLSDVGLRHACGCRPRWRVKRAKQESGLRGWRPRSVRCIVEKDPENLKGGTILDELV